MTKVIARVHPVHLMKCRLSAGWPPTLRPSQSTWAVSPPKIGSYHPHPPSPLLLLLSPFYSTHFTIPQRVEGWVDLSTAVKVHSPCSRLYNRSSFRDKHNCPWCDSNLDPLTPQSDTLTTWLLRPAFAEEITLFAFCLLFLHSFHASFVFSFFHFPL